MKFSVNERMELLLQTQPFAHSDLGALRSNDPGDVSAGLQAVMLPGTKKRPTVSVSYFRRVFGGTAPDLDIGSNRQSAIFLVSTDILKFHIDTNAMFNEQIQDARHRAQFGQTLSISHGLPHKLGLGGELWHFTQPFQNGHAAGFLFAPTYTPRPNLVFDIGFNRGLTSTSTRWEVLYGIYLSAAEEAALAQPSIGLMIYVAQALFCPFTRTSGAQIALPVAEWNLKDAGTDRSVCATNSVQSKL